MRQKKAGLVWCVILAVIATTASAPASAADWLRIFSTKDGSVYYIDLDGVSKHADAEGPYVAAVFKSDDSKNTAKRYDNSLLLYHFQCARSKMKLKKWTNFNTAGEIIQTGDTDKGPLKVIFRTVPDNTVGGQLLRRGCEVANLK